jgi:hypothetical protein
MSATQFKETSVYANQFFVSFILLTKLLPASPLFRWMEPYSLPFFYFRIRKVFLDSFRLMLMGFPYERNRMATCTPAISPINVVSIPRGLFLLLIGSRLPNICRLLFPFSSTMLFYVVDFTQLVSISPNSIPEFYLVVHTSQNIPYCLAANA